MKAARLKIQFSNPSIDRCTPIGKHASVGRAFVTVGGRCGALCSVN